MTRGLTATLALALTLLVVTSAAADNSGKIGSLQQRAAAARAKEAALQAEIQSTTSRIRSLESQAGGVSTRLAALQEDLALHQRRLARINELYDLQSKRLAFLRRQSQLSTKVLEQRVVDIYESDSPDTIAILLSSRSLDDALAQIDYTRSVAKQDVQIAEQVRASRDAARRAHEQTKRVRVRVATATRVVAVRTAQQQALRDQLIANRLALSQSRGAKQRALAQTQAEQAQFIAEANALAAADARVRSELSTRSVSGSSGVPFSSGLIWPASGPVVSGFGIRWGRLHAGIDIAAGYGTPIRAAASGTVVSAGWNGGYGNYTLIDHGNGLSTGYAHQSSIAVGAGASVSQGQVIGYVGNTGHSFGAHLHFEVRVGGSPVDPLGYL